MARIKLGFGFYRHMLHERGYRFARQCGATHAVVHLVDYLYRADEMRAARRGDNVDNQPVGGDEGWGMAGATTHLWEKDELARIKAEMAAQGLTLTALENFDPVFWYDVLLAGPKRDEQLEILRRIIRTMGEVGIPILGYNFSLAGVAGRISARMGRGSPVSVGADGGSDAPIPKGMIWNMVYDPRAPEGNVPPATEEELWERLRYFLEAIIPVAEEAGVTLAAHPDDPPFARVRRQPRLVYTHDRYQRLLNLVPSDRNKLEFCLGSLMEMPGGDIYETTRRHVEAGDIAYIHFRNVVGKVPKYHEVFLDEGDMDMLDIARILHEGGYDGVVIPDHTPLLDCDDGWHAGMAWAMGYMRALLQVVEG